MKKLLLLKEPQSYNNQEEFDVYKEWFGKLREQCKDTDIIPIMVPYRVEILNKEDLITIEQIKELIKK